MSLLTYRVEELDFDESARFPYALSDLIVLGDVGGVRQALETGADPNAAGGNLSDLPLHLAVGLTRPKIARLLLDAGANPNQEDPAGNTPIQLAVDPAMKEMLLAAGAEEPDEVGGSNAQTFTSPLFIAVSAQNPEMIRSAIAEGANPNMQLDQGQSILYLAVALDNPELVRVLLELGANPSLEDANGDSPIDLARSDAVRELLR
jgi:ankyrin repeat protein